MRHLLFIACTVISGCTSENDAEQPDNDATFAHDYDMVSDSEPPCKESMLTKADLNLGIHPVLTVEESLGVACRCRFYRQRRWHVCRGVNPEAVPKIVELLNNTSEKDIWPSAIESLAYVGGDPEALLLEKILLRKYTEPWTSKEQEAFGTTILAIGLMARREVPEARRIADAYCEPDYWLDTAQPWMSRHPLGSHAIARVTALHGRVFADWKVDGDLCARFIKENKDFAVYADAGDLNNILCRMSAGETMPIMQQERDQLRSFYEQHFGKK